MSKRILITGSSSGFGLLSAKRLLSNGHQLAAAMRDPDGKNREVAEQLASLGAVIVDIDVTEQDTIKSGVDEAISKLGHLDVLVNNAGIGVHGIQESFTAEDLQQVFDVNVFGVHRMIRAVLPHFHQRHQGLIVNVSSILGRITIPFYGPYNATKWALEALTENYRSELSGQGVDVALIEPGGFPTDFIARLMVPSDATRANAYGDFGQMPEGSLKGFEQALAENPAQDPQLVAQAIANVIETKAGQRPFRTVVDKMGMGEHVMTYNQQLAEMTEGIYSALGTADLLKLKVQ